jgi:hypothetical protein
MLKLKQAFTARSPYLFFTYHSIIALEPQLAKHHTILTLILPGKQQPRRKLAWKTATYRKLENSTQGCNSLGNPPRATKNELSL